jgi:hypothetical protein
MLVNPCFALGWAPVEVFDTVPPRVSSTGGGAALFLPPPQPAKSGSMRSAVSNSDIGRKSLPPSGYIIFIFISFHIN